MSKYKRHSIIVTVALVFGICLLGTGVYLKVQAAYDPSQETNPGKRLDLVFNLYYRYMNKDGDNAPWYIGPLQELGRYIGGYVIGYRYCNQYEKMAGQTDYYECTNTIQAHGFGIIYQIPPGREGANEIHLIIPLPWSELPPDAKNRRQDYYDKPTILPWFDYTLDTMQNPAGHTFTNNGPIGYCSVGGDCPPNGPYDGYVSLEIRTDLEDLPGPDDNL
jgi:hypothetical protein